MSFWKASNWLYVELPATETENITQLDLKKKKNKKALN